MSWWRLLLANLQRKKLRTLLTLGSYAVACFLFGVLLAVRAAFYQGVEVAGADRLVVINRVSIVQPLPRSYGDKIRAIPGVAAVTSAVWFGGVYQDERNFFPQFAVEVESYRQMFPEFVIPDEQWRAFLADRQGCVVGEATARRFGFRLGQRIPIRGTIFPGVWEFNLRAIYRGSRELDDTTQFWFHQKYLEERASSFWRGLVGWYTVRVADPEQAVKVAKAIDARFANSPWETRTEPERAFAASFVKQLGNIEFLLLVIGSVVFVTLLLVAANTQALVVRERITELGVFKTLGFSNTHLAFLILLESVAPALLGGSLGLLGARGVAPYLSQALPGMNFALPWEQLLLGLALAVLLGALAGLFPARLAARLSVVQALRRL